MDHHKICFISCVNDEDIYREAQFYINQLQIPYGFSVETVAVLGAKSMTGGYNTAMRQTDAKYKIYMHQDVFILRKNFLEDLLEIFQEEDIGGVGMIGNMRIPSHGVWWADIPALEDKQTGVVIPDTVFATSAYGAIYATSNGRIFLNGINGGEPSKKYADAKLLDGLLIATQHDVPWREDVFDGWHFYDLSQSCEFLKRGYRLVVPTQIDADDRPAPWCVHYGDNGSIDDAWQRGRHRFLSLYADVTAQQALPPPD